MDRVLKDTSRTRNTRRAFARCAIPRLQNFKMSTSAVTTFAQSFWTKSWNSTKGRQSIPMLYRINTPENAHTFEALSFTAACVVATLLGGGFYSLWQDGKQVMPVFMFGGVEKWY